MLLISSGKYGTSPDSHLVFINFAIGSTLSFFYTFAPDIEWYTFLIVGCNILSFSIIFKQLLKRCDSILLQGILVVFLLSAFSYFSIQLQFTRTAALLVIAGVSLLVGEKKYNYFGILLIVLGTLIRFEAAILLLLISTPLFIQKQPLKQYLTDFRFKGLLIAIALGGIFKIADYAYYSSDQEWKSYMEYNRLRGKINDNPNASQDIILPTGVAREDYQLLLNAFPNADAVDNNEIREISMTISSKDSVGSKILRNGSGMLSVYKSYLLLLILLVTAALLVNKHARRKITLIFCIFLFLLVLTSLNGIVKERVFFPAYFGTIVFLLTTALAPERKVWSVVFASLVMVCSAGLFLKTVGIASTNRANNSELAKQQKFVKEQIRAGATLIPFGGSYKMQTLNPFSFHSDFPSGHIYLGGWLTKMPLNKNKFDSFDYFIDDYALVIDQSQYDIKKIGQLIQFSIAQNSKTKVTPIVLAESGNNVILGFRKAQ